MPNACLVLGCRGFYRASVRVCMWARDRLTRVHCTGPPHCRENPCQEYGSLGEAADQLCGVRRVQRYATAPNGYPSLWFSSVRRILQFPITILSFRPQYYRAYRVSIVVQMPSRT